MRRTATAEQVPPAPAPVQRASHAVRQLQLAEAARKIITGQGMEHLTIDTLASEVGVSEGAIYRHVRSKQEVLLLVLDDVERTWLDAASRAEQESARPLEKLESLFKGHLSRTERRRGVSFLVLNETLRLGDRELRSRAASIVEGYLSAVRRLLEEGQRAGEVRRDLDVQLAARLFLGMVQGNVTLWALRSHSYPLSEGWEALWGLYRRAVARDPGPLGEEV